MAEGTHSPWAWGHCATRVWLILPLVTESLLLAGKLILAHALSLYLYSPRVAVVLGGNAQEHPGTVMHALRKGELGLCAEGCVAGTAAM